MRHHPHALLRQAPQHVEVVCPARNGPAAKHKMLHPYLFRTARSRKGALRFVRRRSAHPTATLGNPAVKVERKHIHTRSGLAQHVLGPNHANSSAQARSLAQRSRSQKRHLLRRIFGEGAEYLEVATICRRIVTLRCSTHGREGEIDRALPLRARQNSAETSRRRRPRRCIRILEIRGIRQGSADPQISRTQRRAPRTARLSPRPSQRYTIATAHPPSRLSPYRKDRQQAQTARLENHP
jgi:hypothetical protein